MKLYFSLSKLQFFTISLLKSMIMGFWECILLHTIGCHFRNIPDMKIFHQKLFQKVPDSFFIISYQLENSRYCSFLKKNDYIDDLPSLEVNKKIIYP